MVPGSSPV